MKDHNRKCFKCSLTRADPDIVLYRFPRPGVKNILRCESWAKYIFPEGPWSSPEFHQKLFSEHRMLCHKHFKESQFIDFSKKKLHRHAVPDEECDKEDSSVVNIKHVTYPIPTCGDTNKDMYVLTSCLEQSSQTLESEISPDTSQKTSLLKKITMLPCDAGRLTHEEKEDEIVLEDCVEVEGLEDSHTEGQYSQAFSWQKTNAIVPCDSDSHTEGQNVQAFSWQKSNATVPCDADEIIRIEDDECLWEKPATPPPQYCCNVCEQPILGPRYACVQCADWDLCGACEARGLHHHHYVLRVPRGTPEEEVQTVLQRIRQVLIDAIVHLTTDSNVEIKEEENEDPICVETSNNGELPRDSNDAPRDSNDAQRDEEMLSKDLGELNNDDDETDCEMIDLEELTSDFESDTLKSRTPIPKHSPHRRQRQRKQIFTSLKTESSCGDNKIISHEPNNTRVDQSSRDRTLPNNDNSKPTEVKLNVPTQSGNKTIKVDSEQKGPRALIDILQEKKLLREKSKLKTKTVLEEKCLKPESPHLDAPITTVMDNSQLKRLPRIVLSREKCKKIKLIQRLSPVVKLQRMPEEEILAANTDKNKQI